jgi:predicted ATP-grasp superfamily ATP-dependent carboligase
MRALVVEETNFSGALSIVRALGRLGHEVTVAAPGETPALCSRWCGHRIISPSFREPERLLDFLRSLLSENAYDIGFLCDDPIVDLVSPARATLPARADFLLAPEAAVTAARNKATAQRLAAELGVPTPRTAAPRSGGELEEVAREIGFPLVIKADLGAGASHVRDRKSVV